MQITILTLFPEMFQGPFNHSIIKRAQIKHLVSLDLVNLRDFAKGKYRSVDDHPYGGGPGMILRVDVVDRALQQITAQKLHSSKKVLLDPGGTPYRQKMAQEFSKLEHLILVCGHYEGIDDRVRKLVDEVISVGDYVLTGGEIPAMVVVDSTVRLLPQALTKGATTQESFSKNLVEYPQYTKPPVYQGLKVPEVLLSGNHQKIAKWRTEQAVARTKVWRPDLRPKSKTRA